MTNDLVKFRLPASFVVSRVTLRPGELKFGYDHQWLDESGVVGVAEAALAAGCDLVAPIDELALLLSDEFGRVPDLLSDVRDDSADPDRVWLYLALAWLHDHKEEFADPLETVEMLYADFGYPVEIEGFVRYMPPPPGASVGLDALEERWRDYLARQREEYANRS